MLAYLIFLCPLHHFVYESTCMWACMQVHLCPLMSPCFLEHLCACVYWVPWDTDTYINTCTHTCTKGLRHSMEHRHTCIYAHTHVQMPTGIWSDQRVKNYSNVHASIHMYKGIRTHQGTQAHSHTSTHVQRIKRYNGTQTHLYICAYAQRDWADQGAVAQL